MGLFQRWWSYTGSDVPLWKVFWLFWFVPFFVLAISFLVIFLVFNPHLLDATHVDVMRSTLTFRRVTSLVILPLNLLGSYYIYKARLRCKLTYFSILGLLVVFFSTLESAITLLSMI